MSSPQLLKTSNHDYNKPEEGYKNWADEINTNWDDLDVDVLLKGKLADRPSAGTKGRHYLATDKRKYYYDDGSNWILQLSETNKNIVENGDKVTIENNRSMTIAGKYTVNGELEVNGRLSVV